MTHKAKPYSRADLYAAQKQRSFRGSNTLQIAMPLGGIGAGCICLNGQGGLQDFSIRNAPSITALPDGHGFEDAAFAVLHIEGTGVTRLVEGPMPVERIYNQGLKVQGYRMGGHEGLPRFRNCVFHGEYPFGVVDLSDQDVPLDVTLTGFNPFIPLDDVASGIPCAILEYTLRNRTAESVAYQFSYHLSHLAPGSDLKQSRSASIPDTGVTFYNSAPPDSAEFGSAALGVIGFQPEIKAEWFRGGWFDALSVLWRELSTGDFQPNAGGGSEGGAGRSGGSILLGGTLEPGGKVTYPIVVAWYFPNVHAAFGEAKPPETTSAAGSSETGCGCGPGCDCTATNPPRWKPFYTTQWRDAQHVLLHVKEHYRSLRERTFRFKRALFRSTFPSYVLDAVSANLAILKSPTVLRQQNGNLWAWEGCFCTSGCCHGSCTHVWNYAQAAAHLFPPLERTLREQELERSMDTSGHVSFRSALPDGPAPHDFHPAADGQLGGVIKLYREWQVSGDRGWLLHMLPLAKRSLDYCIAHWDPERKGVLEEPHHNTYDIEFWGPDGMCTSFYVAALSAFAQLAQEAGFADQGQPYLELARKGARYLDEELFNGEYYFQKVMLSGLHTSPTEQALAELERSNPAEARLLREEGPKYQYGAGCISDGVWGAWLAQLCGVESAQNRAHIRRNLQAIFDYNFRDSLWSHANTQRPGYALGDEPGLLLCSWPRGGKPTLPFVYSDEVWTGIEYQAAAHMISEGLVEEGLTIVKALRSRYDGRKRNPWNEYECGSYYARALASYGLLIALSGFRYSAPEKTLHLAPRLEGERMETFFSTASGWGMVEVNPEEVVIRLEEGTLEVAKLRLTLQGKTREIVANLHARAGKAAAIGLR